jgi:hypothetical protein
MPDTRRGRPKCSVRQPSTDSGLSDPAVRSSAYCACTAYSSLDVIHPGPTFRMKRGPAGLSGLDGPRMRFDDSAEFGRASTGGAILVGPFRNSA